jgi:hypothetical protein
MKPDSTRPSCCARLGTRCDPTLDSRIFDTALVYRGAEGFAAPRDATLASFAFARRYSPERGAESDQFGRGS